MNLITAVLLATLLGPERPIAPPAFGPAYGTQYPHELATDGTDFLAVWTGIDGVYAAALDEQGVARPTPPHPLFAGYNVRVSWEGDAYVLAWSDGQRTLLARMSRDAQLISAPMLIAEDASPAAIASSGDRTLVIIAAPQNTTGILLGANGEVVQKDIALPTATRPYAVSVTATAGGFVVATVETTYSPSPVHAAATIARATRISADGVLQHSVKLIEGLPHNVNSIDVASDGERVGIAFVARRNTIHGPQRLFAFTVEGRTLGVTAHDPRQVAGDDPQVVRVSGGFAAGLLETRENAPLILLTIPFAADERHVTQLGSSAPGADLRMATNGRRVLSVWRDYRFSPPWEYSTMNMFGVALDATATLPQTAVVPVAISAVAQARPVIASAGEASLVAWMDLTKTVKGNVVVRRVDARGNALDRRPVTIATDVDASQRPVAVFTGQVWIVAWHVVTNGSGGARSYMRRIARDGTILDAEPVDLGVNRVGAAASNGTVTLMPADKSLLRFSPAGERLGTVALPEFAYGGSLATNGREFLMAWNEGSDWWQFPSPNRLDVRAIRLDATGHPMDTAPIDVAMSAANEVGPVVASNGTDFLVAYAHDDRQTYTIRAKRVLRTGVLADFTAADAGSLVGRGEQFFSVTGRDGGYLAAFARPLAQGKGVVESAALDQRGAATDEPVTLATSVRWSLWVAVAESWVAYVRAEPALANIDRVFVRTVGAEPSRRRTIRR